MKTQTKRKYTFGDKYYLRVLSAKRLHSAYPSAPSQNFQVATFDHNCYYFNSLQKAKFRHIGLFKPVSHMS